ncbi:MAG TPA: hypothetical protein VH024_10475, partial [Candidatus Angelobacter sp.]|nr:hypothetical protein [Candidatus Angelobacter sp.]
MKNLLKPKSRSSHLSGLSVFPDLERRITFVTPLAWNASPNLESRIANANLRHAQAAIEQWLQRPLDGSLLSNWPCRKREYKIRKTEPPGKLRGPMGRVESQKGQTAFHFPYRRKLCAFHWTCGQKSLKFLPSSGSYISAIGNSAAVFRTMER